jgi:hypothetical protein
MTDGWPNEPGREHIEVLAETIDRNNDRDWAAYRERYMFTLVNDGTVRISAKDTESSSSFDANDDHFVSLIRGRVAECDCYIARRSFSERSCRHMRAVEAHPRL